MFKICCSDGAWRLVVRCYVVSEGARKETFALLDGGSDRHVVDAGFRCELGLRTEVQRVGVTVLDNFTEADRHVGDVDIEGVNGFCLKLGGAIFGSIMSTKEDVPPCAADIAGLDHLRGIEFGEFPTLSSGTEVKIGVIVGSEHAWTWELGERRSGDRSLPIGVDTEFGWALIGPKSSGSSAGVSSVFHCHHISARATEGREEIQRDYERMFEPMFEPVDEQQQMSVEDKFAMKQLRDSIRFDMGVHRYRVGLPWVKGRAAAAKTLNRLNSSKMALDRLRRSAVRMRADPGRREATFAQMQKFVDEGRVRTVGPEEAANCPFTSLNGRCLCILLARRMDG